MISKQDIFYFLGIGVLIVIFFLVIFGDNGLMDLNIIKNDVKVLKQENKRLLEQNSLLYRKINRLKKDPAYIEAIARYELGMIGADEIIFKFKK